MSELQALVDNYLAFAFRRDPIDATHLGIHDDDHLLGELDAGSFIDEIATRKGFLNQVRSIDSASLSADEQTDLQILIVDLEPALRRLEDLRTWVRAPYWYLERLGGLFSYPIGRGSSEPTERGRRLLSRLKGAPTCPSSYLVGKTFTQNLRDDIRCREGDAFTLKSFNDRLLSYGSPPVKLVTHRMLA